MSVLKETNREEEEELKRIEGRLIFMRKETFYFYRVEITWDKHNRNHFTTTFFSLSLSLSHHFMRCIFWLLILSKWCWCNHTLIWGESKEARNVGLGQKCLWAFFLLPPLFTFCTVVRKEREIEKKVIEMIVSYTKKENEWVMIILPPCFTCHPSNCGIHLRLPPPRALIYME